RNEVYVIACDALNDWVAARKYPPKLQEIAKNGIIRTAIANGFFSVWMEVFSDEAEICQALIRAFPGTAGDCFDSDGSPLAACRIHSQPVCV
ncbi:MAG: hypothetical protein IKC03_06580, partial [Oscillospiraceae bacterium]|nr:hypothetical protein [Oscillospiraceae bacterium]